MLRSIFRVFQYNLRVSNLYTFFFGNDRLNFKLRKAKMKSALLIHFEANAFNM